MYDSLIDKYSKNDIDKKKIIKLAQEASNRIFYRINEENNKSYILMDSSKEPEQYINLLKVYNLIKDIDISIPKITDYDSRKYFVLFEDFGDNRFDKLINNSNYNNLLFKIAMQSLVVIKKNGNVNKKIIPTYNFDYIEKEISEFLDWYYPFIWKNKASNSIKKEFIDLWKKLYSQMNFVNKDIVHRDFFCNNLIYLPSRKNHLKCGIIDYQDAFMGDQILDVVSLFEDSRRIIDQSCKESLIEYYLRETNQLNEKKNFIIKLNFLGACRQTRILGRWVKLFNKKKNIYYLNCLNYTWHWLEKNLSHSFLNELNNFYNDLIPKNKRKYEN